MKKTFYSPLVWLLTCLLSLAGLQHARASHAQAGQLTYESLGNNQYRVRLQFFRDCSGIPAPTSFTLNCSSAGCASASVTATMNQVGTPVIGQPYCAAQQVNAVCPLTGSAPAGSLDNFATYTYEATVTLPPAAEWVLSAEESARPSVANLSSSTFGTLRLEATLNNLITLQGGGGTRTLINNSPVFSTVNLPVPFVPVNQESTVSFAAADPDRLNNGRADSLVYSLDRPLSGCNAFETYAAYPGTACVTGVDPRCASRIVRCNGLSASYSVTLPIPVANDTVRGACTPGTVTYADIRPRFLFNASSGSFTFTPNVFVPITSANPSSAGRNKYAVVGKVTEYRKINGRYYKVGSVRRDFLVIVIGGVSTAGNQVPSAPTGTVVTPQSNATVVNTRDTTLITVYTCNYSRVRLAFTDPDNTPSNTSPQNLTVFFPADINANLLQGGDIGSFVLSRNGTPTPTGTFFFQPAASTAGTTLLLNFRVEDDGCPAKGVQYRTVVVRVRRGNFGGVRVAGTLGAGSATVCLGGSVQLQGTAQRPDSVRNVATGQTLAQTYAYQWTATGTSATSGLSAAQASSPAVTVTPTTTTRYRLSIAPTLGFGAGGGGCADTASVLVQVVPQPAPPVITRNGNTLASSATGGNQWYLNGNPIAGATGATYGPAGPGTYTVVASVGTGAVRCASNPSAPLVLLAGRAPLPGTSLRVLPNPTADGLLRVELTGYRQAVELTLFDALGRTVRTGTLPAPSPQGSSVPLDLSQLPTGLYVLHVRTPGGLDACRVVRE